MLEESISVLSKNPPPKSNIFNARVAHDRITALETALGMEHAPMLSNVRDFTARIAQLESLLTQRASAGAVVVEPPKSAPIADAPDAIPATMRGLERAVMAHEQKTRRGATVSRITTQKSTPPAPAAIDFDLSELALAVFGKNETFRIIAGSKNKAESDFKIRQRLFREWLVVPGLCTAEFSETDKVTSPSGLERAITARKQAAIHKFLTK